MDLHTHSEASPDSRTPVAEQARAVRAAGIDVIAATDHNTIDGALRLREIAEGFRVIIGEEISSRDGELIGLFLESAVPRDLSGQDTIARIHDQGGLVVVPHPFSVNRRYRIRRDALHRMWPQIDAIEVFNAREAFGRDNRAAAAFAQMRRLPGTAGSDAHRASEIGAAFVEMPDFAGHDDFLDALREGVPQGHLIGMTVSFYAGYDRLREWLRRKGSSTAR